MDPRIWRRKLNYIVTQQAEDSLIYNFSFEQIGNRNTVQRGRISMNRTYASIYYGIVHSREVQFPWQNSKILVKEKGFATKLQNGIEKIKKVSLSMLQIKKIMKLWGTHSIMHI